MVQFRPQAHEVIAKVVYYGPPLGGKTTNLRTLYQGYPSGARGELVVVPTGGDRTIFFDFLPIFAGKLRQMDLRVQLYTVPGQVHYNATRQVVLRGVDGVVFVADSQRELMRSNKDSFDNLKENLLLQGLDLAEIPHVLQYNKRDLAEIVPVEEMDALLNEYNAPFFESVATVGIGVEETLQAVVKLVVRSLRERFQMPLEAPLTQPVVVPPSVRPTAAGKGAAVRVPEAPRAPAGPGVGVAPASVTAPPPVRPPRVAAPPPSAQASTTRPPVTPAATPSPPTQTVTSGEGAGPFVFAAVPPPAPQPAPVLPQREAAPARVPEQPFGRGAIPVTSPSVPTAELPAVPPVVEELVVAEQPPAEVAFVAPPGVEPEQVPSFVGPPLEFIEVSLEEPGLPQGAVAPEMAAEPFASAPAFAEGVTREPPTAEAVFVAPTEVPPVALPPSTPPMPFVAASGGVFASAPFEPVSAVTRPVPMPPSPWRVEADQPFPVLGAPALAATEDVFALAPLPPKEVEPIERVVLGELQPRVLAALGNVRELELEIPVPSKWISGRRMTVQLRLTLVPQEDDHDA